jgi:prevent-host-death family protein
VRHREIGLRKLKRNLKTVVRGVKRGGTVTVTSHGQPIARIVGLPEVEGTSSWQRDRALLLSSSSAHHASDPPPNGNSARQRPDARTLVLRCVGFYSRADEHAFFARLDTLACVESYEGVGLDLRVMLKPGPLDEDAADQLMALFARYELRKSPEPLRPVTSHKAFRSWLDDPNGYWDPQ